MESLDASWSGCLLRSASDAPYRSARPSRRVLNACANKTKVASRHCCSRLARREAVHGRAGYGTDSHGKHEESRDMIPNGCLVLICWATTLLGTMTRAESNPRLYPRRDPSCVPLIACRSFSGRCPRPSSSALPCRQAIMSCTRCPPGWLMGFVPSSGKPREVASIDLEVW